MTEIQAIAFSLSKEWTYRAKKEAIDGAGSFENLIQTSQKKIESLDLHTAENQFKKLEKHGGWLWIYGQKNYPETLAKILDPPLVVYGNGVSTFDLDTSLAFIGTREPTPYGNRIGRTLAKELIEQGLLLVSGLARGIDSVAHKVSVDMSAPTIAVVAHGLDTLFPSENKKLAQNILECGGSIVSEFPFGIKPLPPYFVQRNRIISGLSKAVLVIEAGEKSGTRHTVNYALEQNREIFAVPGPIDSEYSKYTNELIFSGATMVRTSSDILEFYPNSKSKAVKQVSASFKPNKLQVLILEFLDKDTPKAIEDFMSITRSEPRQVIQSLTELELHGKILKQTNSMYILAGT